MLGIVQAGMLPPNGAWSPNVIIYICNFQVNISVPERNGGGSLQFPDVGFTTSSSSGIESRLVF